MKLFLLGCVLPECDIKISVFKTKDDKQYL